MPLRKYLDSIGLLRLILMQSGLIRDIKISIFSTLAHYMGLQKILADCELM